MYTQDTRTLRPGDVYIALRGTTHDGHAFVEKAFELGAAEVWVCSDYAIPETLRDRPVRVFDDTRKALLEEARRYRLSLKNVFVVGITGSAGKTTTKEFAKACFSAAGKTAATAGNYNNDIGLPLTLLNLPSDVRYAVIEAGTNHPGEIRTLAEVMCPDAAIITGIGPAHIEYFGSLEAIANEKADLFRAVPGSGFCVMPTDCIVPHEACRGKLLFPLSDELPELLPGEHNRSNLALAYTAARAAGLSREIILEGLKSFVPPAMRWERKKFGPYDVINDAYNANPLSMVSALKTFRQTPAESKVAVIGDMRELGPDSAKLHYEAGKTAGNGDWRLLVIVGTDAVRFAEGAIAAGYPRTDVRFYPTAEAAGNEISQWLSPGDLFLLKASRGMKLETILSKLPINHPTVPFTMERS